MLSIWERQSFTNYDVVIVGSGISGLSAAASLKEQDPSLSVLILESGLLPSGASTKNAGFACFGSLSELLADFHKMGRSKTKELVSKRWKGLRKLRSRLTDQRIGFLQNGGYELLDDQNAYLLQKIDEVNDLLEPVFHQAVFSDQSQKVAEFGFKGYEGMIFNPLEGQLDTGEMMKSLLAHCQQLGVSMLTGASVKGFSHEGERVQVETRNGLPIQCRVLGLCTNAFTPNLIPTDLKPGRGLVLAIKPEQIPFRGTFHVEEGFYYFRDYHDYVIFGGGRNLDFETETTTAFDVNPAIESRLLSMLEESILPGQQFEITDRWTGIMAFGDTKEPIIQEVEQGVFLGVRLGGMGVAIGSLVGEQLASLMRASL